MKKLVLLLAIITTSCTPEEQQEKCFKIIASGWDSQIGYFIQDPERNVIATQKKLETGTVYCRE